jgi:MFS family permease
MLGLFFSLGKIIGVLIATFLELIFDATTFSWSWRILLSLTAFFLIIQAVLIFFFGSDTPTEMIEKGNEP